MILTNSNPLLFFASASPRRAALLKQMGLICSTEGIDADEDTAGIQPENAARVLAERKLTKALELGLYRGHPFVAAADTIVLHEGTIFGKPRNRLEASEFLRILMGKTHYVITGIALFSRDLEKSISNEESTTVSMAHLEETEIEWYLDSGEWKDAAGGYKIQEKGSRFITEINGSPSNVAGLPIHLFYGMLKTLRYPLNR